MTKFCIDCIYAMAICPEDGSKFYQCGNPEYTKINVVDKSKKYPTCERARQWLFPRPSAWCGPEGDGFLPIVPEVKTPVPSRARIVFFELRSLWYQRRNLVRPSYWHYMRGWWGRLALRLSRR